MQVLSMLDPKIGFLASLYPYNQCPQSRIVRLGESMNKFIDPFMWSHKFV